MLYYQQFPASEVLCAFRREEMKRNVWDEKLGKVTMIEKAVVTPMKVG